MGRCKNYGWQSCICFSYPERAFQMRISHESKSFCAVAAYFVSCDQASIFLSLHGREFSRRGSRRHGRLEMGSMYCIDQGRFLDLISFPACSLFFLVQTFAGWARISNLSLQGYYDFYVDSNNVKCDMNSQYWNLAASFSSLSVATACPGDLSQYLPRAEY